MQQQAKTNGHRLTPRDRVALDLVAALHAIRLDDTGVLLAGLAGRGGSPLGARTTRDVVARWRALDLVRLEPYPGQGPAILVPTGRATSLGRLPRPRSLSWVETPHTLTTAAVAALYVARAGGTWLPESRLRARTMPGQHLPDGVWQSPGSGGPVAVEVERTGKAGARWEGIAFDLLSRFQTVHYWLSENTAPAWKRWADERLIEGDRARIRTYGLEAYGVDR